MDVTPDHRVNYNEQKLLLIKEKEREKEIKNVTISTDEKLDELLEKKLKVALDKACLNRITNTSYNTQPYNIVPPPMEYYSDEDQNGNLRSFRDDSGMNNPQGEYRRNNNYNRPNNNSSRIGGNQLGNRPTKSRRTRY